MKTNDAMKRTDPPIPNYRWVPGTPNEKGSNSGCTGCAFRRMPEIRCSRIPCQEKIGWVAQLIEKG